MKTRRSRRRAVGSAMALTAVLACLGACTSAATDTAAAAQSATSAQTTGSSASVSVVQSPSAAPEVPIPAPAATPVPAPQSGDIRSTVPAVPVTTMPAVPVDRTAAVSAGVSVEVQKVAAVTGVARGPGEVGGPAAAVTVKLTNNSDQPLALSQLQVTAGDKAGTPTPSLSGAPAAAMAGSLDAGQSSTGVYVFSLGKNFSSPLQISISYSAGAPVALFTAAVSK